MITSSVVQVRGEGNLSGVAAWVAKVIDALGEPGVGLLVAIENIFPPIPSEIVLPLAGFTAGQGKVDVILVIIWATAGSVAGALALYGLGALLGHERAYRLFARIPLVTTADLDRSTDWLARHQTKAVLYGRFVPVVRGYVSVPAGIERMPLTPFCLYTAAGSAAWNTLFVLLGYALGEKWQKVEVYVGWFTWGVIAVIVVMIIRFVVTRLRGRDRTERGGSPRPAGRTAGRRT